MGSYSSWYIDVNTNNVSLLGDIVDAGRKIDKQSDPYWDKYCFRVWSPRDKWIPHEFLSELSRAFPELIFSLDCRGESASSAGKIYFMNGKSVHEADIWKHPEFPSKPLMKKVLSSNEKREQILLAQQEVDRVKKQVEYKEKRIKELQEELENLKKTE